MKEISWVSLCHVILGVVLLNISIFNIASVNASFITFSWHKEEKNIQCLETMVSTFA